MVGSIARDLVLRAVVQDVVRLTHLDEAICRQAVYAVTDTAFAPAAFTQATEQLIAGLRAGDTRVPVVGAFWNEV